MSASSLSRRKVQTANTSQDINLVPRHERWYGSFGQYAATGSSREVHVSAEEGYQYFASVEELLHWLAGLRDRGNVAYTSDGLILMWKYSVRPTGHAGGPSAALTLEVWQTWVKGQKPTGLPGATDSAFHKRVQSTAVCAAPPVVIASDPAVIDGRTYSGRAIDLLKERGIETKDVEYVVKNGNSERTGASTVYVNPRRGGELAYVEVGADGKVLSIG